MTGIVSLSYRTSATPKNKRLVMFNLENRVEALKACYTRAQLN